MRKPVSKLALTTETIKQLNVSTLYAAAGGTKLGGNPKLADVLAPLQWDPCEEFPDLNGSEW